MILIILKMIEIVIKDFIIKIINKQKLTHNIVVKTG